VLPLYNLLYNWLFNRLYNPHERSQAALERSRLSLNLCSKAAVWTVDDVARLIDLKKILIKFKELKNLIYFYHR